MEITIDLLEVASIQQYVFRSNKSEEYFGVEI